MISWNKEFTWADERVQMFHFGGRQEDSARCPPNSPPGAGRRQCIKEDKLGGAWGALRELTWGGPWRRLPSAGAAPVSASLGPTPALSQRSEPSVTPGASQPSLASPLLYHEGISVSSSTFIKKG